MGAPINTIRNQMTALLPRLRRFALSLTGDATDADDLVQDTVERALRNLQRWEDGTRLDSWMFRIAQNLWIDNVRARRVRASVPLEDRHGSPVDGVRDTEARLTFADTCRALANLPEDQRVVVSLVLVDGMAYRDAAEVLGVPIGTVTSRLSRAREALSVRVFGKQAETLS